MHAFFEDGSGSIHFKSAGYPPVVVHSIPLLLEPATTSSCRCTLGSTPRTTGRYRTGEPEIKRRAVQSIGTESLENFMNFSAA